MIELGADIEAEDDYGMTPLMHAAENNSNPEVITKLVKFKADIKAKDDNNKTSLMYAAENNSNPEVIAKLIELGADILAKDNSGKSALDYAADNKNQEIKVELKKLIDLIVNSNRRNNTSKHVTGINVNIDGTVTPIYGYDIEIHKKNAAHSYTGNYGNPNISTQSTWTRSEKEYNEDDEKY